MLDFIFIKFRGMDIRLEKGQVDIGWREVRLISGLNGYQEGVSLGVYQDEGR